jgi:phosphate transport system substrate-binding protein
VITRRRLSAVVVTVAAAAGLAACGSSSNTTTNNSSTTGGSTGSVASGTINGAGSTLAAPIYQQWGSNLQSKGLTVNYSPVGSGTGIANLESVTSDFAGSDPALAAADVAMFTKGAPAQFPVAFGAITVSYNLPGIKSGIKLDGKVIGDIFALKVTKWNDPEITALNPSMSLPSTAITVVHRSDSSGTTAGFTKFVAAYSKTFVNTVGPPGKLVNWPSGTTGAAKNSGVAAAIKQTQGSIGYVEQAYALQNGFTYASVQNSHGTYVLPTLPNTTLAAVGIKIPADLGISTINSPNPSAYPIVSQTFLVVYKDMCKAGISESTAKGVYSFLSYGIGAGQAELGASSNQLPYAGLPPKLVAADKAQLTTLTCNGTKLTG